MTNTSGNLISTQKQVISPTITIDRLLKYDAANSSLGIDFSNYTYDGLRAQLYNKMSENEALLDLIPASTISILVDLIAAIGDFDQYSCESALQENFFDTAKLSSSIYTLARNAAIRLQRNIPCNVQVTLFRSISDTTVNLPRWTQFKINNESYFNREPILMQQGTNQVENITLYQGEIKYQEFISTGEKFQSYEVGDEAFVIADEDIRCWVNEEEWTRDLRGLFVYTLGDKKWYENTLPNGLVQAKFGNDVYGKIPDVGSIIKFGYVNTKGSAAQAPAIDLEVKIVGNNLIKGVCTSAIQGGDMYRDAYYYSKMGPSLSAVNERAVTREDYRAYITKYPGVKDGLIRGQAELAPNRKEWMNVLAVTCITDRLWDEGDFQGLVNWLREDYSMYSMQFVRIDPIAYDVFIDVDLLCLPTTDLDNMITVVEEAIRELFNPKVGTLGKAIYRSDIENVILKAGGYNLDKIKLNSPQVDYIVKNTEFLRIGGLEVRAQFIEDAFE